jgi:glycosyltransferase involved in cell wall biosynthesis
MSIRVALVHDYLTQRGGAERVVLSMLRVFPNAPLYCALYWPEGTFPEFQAADIHVSALNRVPAFRRYHRLALPFLASAFSRMSIEADVVLCSSSGWAHGVRARGRKVVYCYTPARWLYQRGRYIRRAFSPTAAALAVLRPHLVRWDRRAAATADRYVTLSGAVRDRIRSIYGIEAEVVPAPPTLDPDGPREPIPGLEPGFFFSVSRLLAYKNLGAVVRALEDFPDRTLVLAGAGPEERRLRSLAPSNVRFVGSVSDAELRWLYAHCSAVVSAAFEDYGLTPLEAAAFGKPSAVLRWGGFLDTVLEGRTGVFFDRPTAPEVGAALRRVAAGRFEAEVLQAHAARFSERVFSARLRQIIDEAARGSPVTIAEASSRNPAAVRREE